MIFEHEQAIDKVVGQQFREIAAFVEDCRQKGKRIDEVERGLVPLLFESGRLLLQQYVEAAGPDDVGETYLQDGVLLTRSRERHIKVYRSVFGVLSIHRYVYARAERQRAISPLDKRLGLPEGEQSYLLEDWLGCLATGSSYAESVALLEKLLVGTSVRAAEKMVARMAEHSEGYRQERTVEGSEDERVKESRKRDEAVLVVSADGKGVPMRRSLEQRLQDERGVRPHRRSCKTTYEKAKKRRLRNTGASRKQVAYVGVAYSIAPWTRTPASLLDEMHRKQEASSRPVPKNKRYWAEMTQLGEEEVSLGSGRLFEALRKELVARDPQHRKPWVCLMDGQVSLWNLQKKHLPEAVGILDVFHVTEKLWQAAYDFHPQGSARAEEFVDRYLRMLLEGKVGSVIGVFRRYLNQRVGHKQKTKGLNEAIRYFEANRQAMRYNEYLAAGYPVGSGVVEGACRHVVKDRMERTGMRWNIEGAQAILDLRTTHLNREWPAFMEYRICAEQQRLYGQAT